MLFIPAIDLMDGRCVRLVQGDFERRAEYAGEPADVALRFRDDGARMIHVVDLDAARSTGGPPAGGPPGSVNLRTVEAIARSAGVPVEVGGGVRDRGRARALLNAGASFVVLGTILVRDPRTARELVREFGERLVAGIDARGGIVRVSGWTESGGVPALEAGEAARDMGFRRIVYTDIARDGMLDGPNIDETRAMAVGTGLEITASGGVSTMDDLARLKTLEPLGVSGVISGKALYEGKLSVRDACAFLQGGG